MRSITRADAEAELTRRQDEGHHVDSRLMHKIQNPGQLFLLSLEDQESFMSLIWTDRLDSRLLTPWGPRPSRMLRSDSSSRDIHSRKSVLRSVCHAHNMIRAGSSPVFPSMPILTTTSSGGWDSTCK